VHKSVDCCTQVENLSYKIHLYVLNGKNVIVKIPIIGEIFVYITDACIQCRLSILGLIAYSCSACPRSLVHLYIFEYTIQFFGYTVAFP